jgi:pantoate--beta-alanine ligase
MRRFTDPAALQAWAQEVRARGETIGFVPTMGFLHDGHISLMHIARPNCDHLVVSIFVNPLQFGPDEDLDRYPRNESGDAARCVDAGVDVLFFPTPATMYPEGFQTRVKAGPLASPLCGASRQGHFDGVVTVVLKLFNIVLPHRAVFGAKDYQQFQVIDAMVRDLNLPVVIEAGPIVRETDGLAMSSRNAYLSDEERRQALCLHDALGRAEAQVAGGERDVAKILARARGIISAQALANIDYVELLDAEHLTPIQWLERPAVLAFAVRFGKTRLIDNRVLSP